MEENDVRWIQRLANYNKALAQLTRHIKRMGRAEINSVF